MCLWLISPTTYMNLESVECCVTDPKGQRNWRKISRLLCSLVHQQDHCESWVIPCNIRKQDLYETQVILSLLHSSPVSFPVPIPFPVPCWISLDLQWGVMAHSVYHLQDSVAAPAVVWHLLSFIVHGKIHLHSSCEDSNSFLAPRAVVLSRLHHLPRLARIGLATMSDYSDTAYPKQACH